MRPEFKIITAFPEMFPGILAHSIIGNALTKGLWQLSIIDLKEFGYGKHNRLDCPPYGGGAGMVMRPDVAASAIDAAISGMPAEKYKIIYPSPRGARLSQPLIKNYASAAQACCFIMLCARFEGVDQRILRKYHITEISLGDYVISGGELAAMVIMDAMLRYCPGIIGDEQSLAEESFGDDPKFSGLLEYDQYTRPAVWQGDKVPEVLTSGDHAAIGNWRLENARKLTAERRPDLLRNADDSYM